MKTATVLKLVRDELKRAQKYHPPMNSTHEGYAVILEEIEELWVEIKANSGSTHRGASEAVQVAAMAIRYLVDLCADETATQHETKVMTHVYYGQGGYSG